jgi:signal transduction histidine kinase
MARPLPFIAAALALAGPVAAGAAHEPLTTAAQVLSLSGDEASNRYAVTVTGVVTVAEPDWSGQFFVQDATGGVFVENLNHPSPSIGDVVTVVGVTHPGAFAPIITLPQWTRVGSAALPEPLQVPIEDLKTGALDGQRVVVSGRVRTAHTELGRLVVDLSVAGTRLQVQAHPPFRLVPGSLIGAQVRVTGTAVTHYLSALRHLTSVAVYACRPEDFVVVSAETGDPLAEPVLPINSLDQYRRGRKAEQQVHVRGTVTLQRPGEELFIQDASGGIRVRTDQAAAAVVGHEADVVGFLEVQDNLPLLSDARVVDLGRAGAPIVPATISPDDISRGRVHGNLVALTGRILDRNSQPRAQSGGQGSGQLTTWLVQGRDLTFTIESDDPSAPGLDAVPLGSTVRADGVCVSTVDVLGKVTSMRLLLPSPASLRVLERPSWLTPGRLMAGLSLVGAGLVVALAWLLTVSKKNAALRRIVHELELAQRELQEAHDTLEQKVAERSAQLQVEMTARKTAEVQFKAVLAERTRLARDLHDTIEQTLAGIALRLSTAAKLSRQDLEASEGHLQIARNLLHQSQVGLRRSIWDLRSRELEQFDLAAALRQTADQMVHNTDIRLDFRTVGNPAGLPEVVEENVLRIGQEAITNIAKHARAKRVGICLEFEPTLLRLRVEDDGVGFETTGGGRDGHFGLVGMQERAKRLSGAITVSSAPGRGTSIVVEVPLKTAEAPIQSSA